MSKDLPVCAECGDYEESHHTFRPIRIPDDCKCTDESNYSDWSCGDIPPVCSTFTVDSSSPVRDRDQCDVCGHEPDCHKDSERRILDKRQLKLFP